MEAVLFSQVLFKLKRTASPSRATKTTWKVASVIGAPMDGHSIVLNRSIVLVGSAWLLFRIGQHLDRNNAPILKI
jgi:hypothetical protein